VIVNYTEAITELADLISDISADKGFWPEDQDGLLAMPLKLALVHDEVSEALEVHRANYDDGDIDLDTQMSPMQEEDFTEELADIVIRVLDIAGFHDLQIGEAIINKIERNRERPLKHGKRY